MSLAELETQIIEARNESLACAIIGDAVGAQLAHQTAVDLEHQRQTARQNEIPILSEK